ncbi:MAG: prepilin peptidase [Pseudomonadota bacterium]
MIIIHYGLLVALAIALLFAAYTDVRSRKIANWLNIAIAAGAPAFWWASGLSLWPDMAWQLGFAIVVSGLLIGVAWIGYKIGVVILGGGDIKLLGALALWLTPLNYVDMLWHMALCGGAIAIFFLLRLMIMKPKTRGVLPYGVAIAFGTLWVLYPQLAAVPNLA